MAATVVATVALAAVAAGRLGEREGLAMAVGGGAAAGTGEASEANLEGWKAAVEEAASAPAAAAAAWALALAVVSAVAMAAGGCNMRQEPAAGAAMGTVESCSRTSLPAGASSCKGTCF